MTPSGISRDLKTERSHIPEWTSRGAIALLGRSLAMTRARVGSLAILGVGSRLIWSFAMGPTLSMAVAFLVARKGRYSFGNEDILEFALSPTGIFTGVVAATLFLFAQTAEVASLLLLGRQRDAGAGAESRSVRAAWGTLVASPRLFDLAARESLVLIAMAAPFLAAVGATYWWLWTGWDLNYLVEVRPPRFWLGAGIAGALLAVYAVLAFRQLVRWAFALPIVLFESSWGRAAMQASAGRARGHWWRIARVAAAWVAATVAAHAATVAIVGSLGRFVLSRAGDSLAVALPAAAGVLAMHVLAISAVGFAANAVGAFLLLQIYEGETPEADGATAPRTSWLPSRAALMIASASVCGVAGFLSFGLIASVRVRDDILITGHRGDARDAPENTVAAFLQAIDAGADYGELDVQLSKDGHVVVAHDEDFLRLVGLKRKVRDMTLEELRGIDLGSAFSPSFRGEHVPTLEEVIDAVGDRLKILIEIKVYPGDDTPDLVRKTVDLIHRKRFGARCIVISLSYEALRMVRKIDPTLALGYLVSESVGDASRLDVDALMVRAPLATPGLIARANRRGRRVDAWTVDSPEQMVRLWGRGVANVITNDPRGMIAARARVRAMSDAERVLLRVRDLLGG